MLKKKVSQAVRDNKTRICIIAPTDKMKRSKSSINGDFGLSISMTAKGRLETMVKVFLLGKGEKLEKYEIVLVTDPSNIPNMTEVILDFRTFFIS